jgi:hypothetical protein
VILPVPKFAQANSISTFSQTSSQLSLDRLPAQSWLAARIPNKPEELETLMPTMTVEQMDVLGLFVEHILPLPPVPINSLLIGDNRVPQDHCLYTLVAGNRPLTYDEILKCAPIILTNKDGDMALTVKGEEKRFTPLIIRRSRNSNGKSVAGPGEIAEWVSEILQQKCSLKRTAEPISAPLVLINYASLAALNRKIKTPLSAEMLGAHIVVNCEALQERTWSNTVQIDQAEFQIGKLVVHPTFRVDQFHWESTAEDLPSKVASPTGTLVFGRYVVPTKSGLVRKF